MSFAKRFKKNPRRNSPPRPRKGGTQSGRRKLQFEQLEPRLLLNAHPLALVAAAVKDFSVQIVDDHGTPTIQIVDQHAANPGSAATWRAPARRSSSCSASNQAWHAGQKEVTVQLTDRIIPSPFAAKRPSVLLSNLLREHEGRFGALSIDRVDSGKP